MGLFDKLFGKSKPAPKPAPQQEKTIDPNAFVYNPIPEPVAPDPEPTITIPESIDGKRIAYSYSDVKLITPAGVPESRIIPTQQLTLIEDGEEIKVNQGEIYIGSLPKNRLSGMVHDWNKKGDPYLSYLSHYDDDGLDIEIHLVFYADILASYLKRNPNAKLVKLTGKPDELACPAIGQECEVEFDDDKEKYFVSQDSSLIGWLPASATKYADDHGLSPEDLDIIVADIDYDFEKDRDIISVYISE